MEVKKLKGTIAGIIISVLISTLVTEMRCRIHYQTITAMVDETLDTMKKVVDECMESIKRKFMN